MQDNSAYRVKTSPQNRAKFRALYSRCPRGLACAGIIFLGILLLKRERISEKITAYGLVGPISGKVPLTPLALCLGEGSAMLRPLAIAIISGLIIQLPLVLVGLPALLTLMNKRL